MMIRAAGLLLTLLFPAMLWARDIEATLQWSRLVDLSTPVSGMVSEVLADAGAYVRRGQVLMRLDDRGFKAEVNRARAELERLRVKRDEAERELKRAREMHERDLFADHELELARIGFVTTDSEYQAAEAALTRAELDLEYSVIRAPFDCILLKRMVEVGQTIISTTKPVPLFTVAEAGYMVARIRITHEQLSRLSLNQRVSVKVAGKRYEGMIVRLGMEPAGVRAGRQLYEVDIRFGFDPAITMRAGQPAAVALP